MVDLEPKDVPKLSPYWRQKVRWAFRHQVLPPKVDAQGNTVCVALKGKLGEKCRCAIYETRPRACRVFERGGSVCLQLRQEHGL